MHLLPLNWNFVVKFCKIYRNFKNFTVVIVLKPAHTHLLRLRNFLETSWFLIFRQSRCLLDCLWLDQRMLSHVARTVHFLANSAPCDIFGIRHSWTQWFFLTTSFSKKIFRLSKFFIKFLTRNFITYIHFLTPTLIRSNLTNLTTFQFQNLKVNKMCTFLNIFLKNKSTLFLINLLTNSLRKIKICQFLEQFIKKTYKFVINKLTNSATFKF